MRAKGLLQCYCPPYFPVFANLPHLPEPMKHLTPIFLLSCLLMACQSGPDLPTWLNGTWAAGDGTNMVAEQWSSDPNGMDGRGLLIAGSDTTEHERLRVEVIEGVLTYTADVPENPNPVNFPATKVGPTELVFENPDYTFPQLIHYRLAAPDSLVIHVEGVEDGIPLAFDLNLRKANS